MARVDLSNALKYPLPGDMSAELVEAFNHYDKEGMGWITMQHFHNILHNFGFHQLSKKEQDDELRRNDQDILKRQGVDLAACKVFIGYRWNKGK